MQHKMDLYSFSGGQRTPVCRVKQLKRLQQQWKQKGQPELRLELRLELRSSWFRFLPVCCWEADLALTSWRRVWNFLL